GRPFNWRVAVSALSAGVTPYKQVQVTVSYVDENSQTQVVSLMNYVTYPYIHVISNNIPAGAVVTPSYQRLYSVPVTFSTKKSIQLSYNLAIRVNNAANIQALDTVYTLARLVKNGSVLAYFYPETRTPIMTQPLINNWVELDGLSLQGCTLEILWHKETAVPGAGVVTLKTGNVIVIAVEDKS
ncbi:MAG TPA: hypothetical protein VNI01_09005, partial [Elusimicrobiota bacterium]|nr:hypothetical protein [Elusimicrobiota bacterium]